MSLASMMHSGKNHLRTLFSRVGDPPPPKHTPHPWKHSPGLVTCEGHACSLGGQAWTGHRDRTLPLPSGTEAMEPVASLPARLSAGAAGESSRGDGHQGPGARPGNHASGDWWTHGTGSDSAPASENHPPGSCIPFRKRPGPHTLLQGHACRPKPSPWASPPRARLGH